MKGSFWRREWGAVTFVLAVLVGAVVVPLALYFGNHGTTPSSLPAAASAASVAATSSSAR